MIDSAKDTAGASPSEAPKITVSALVVNYSRADLLEQCLRSVLHALTPLDGPTELVVVDNGSTDHSLSMVRSEFPDARVVPLAENRGFAGGANAGIQSARGEWILLLNNDATIEPSAIAAMISAAETQENVGSVAALMLFADRPDTVNSAGIAVDRLGVAVDRLVGSPRALAGSKVVEVFGASGGAALYRRAMLKKLGGFDESFFAFLEDVDLAWRARMEGWRAVLAPSAVVLHHHSATARHRSDFKNYFVGRNRVRLLAKNADRSLIPVSYTHLTLPTTPYV